MTSAVKLSGRGYCNIRPIAGKLPGKEKPTVSNAWNSVQQDIDVYSETWAIEPLKFVSQMSVI